MALSFHSPQDAVLALLVGLFHHQAAADEAQFVQRFNRLVEAVAIFRQTYNERGTVEAKQVQALKKAWRDLEKNDLLFADRKKK